MDDDVKQRINKSDIWSAMGFAEGVLMGVEMQSPSHCREAMGIAAERLSAAADDLRAILYGDANTT